MAADDAAFAGDGGAALASMAATLIGGNPSLAGMAIAPGVEIRSRADGSLRLAGDWNLAGSSARSGAAPVLTLRSANDLLVGYSLSDGFAGLGANSAVLGGSGASFRLVGGADLAAADPLATRDAPAGGDVVIGRAAASASTAPPLVLLRTTTGSIDIAAARDILTYVPPAPDGAAADRRSQVRVYTTGTAVAAADLPGFDRSGIRAADQFLRSGTTTVGPFFTGAGDITLAAGRDIDGSPAVVYSGANAQGVQYVSDWWYRQATAATATLGETAALWARYDLFAQGFASFGGGSLRATAGRDIVDLDLSTPTTGYRVGATPDGSQPAQQRWFTGGALEVSAGRDVVGGLLDAGGARARLVAGGSLTGAANPLQPFSYGPTQLFYENTAWTVVAAGDLRLGTPTDPALMSGAAQGTERSPRTDLVTHLAPDAAATLISLSGDVAIAGARPPSTSGTNPGSSAASVPDRFTVVAPGGAISAGTLAQRPVGDAAFELLARDGVSAEAVRLVAPVGTDAAAPQPQALADAEALFNVATREWSRSQGTPPATLAPARLVSLDGDVALSSVTSFSARSLRIVAGRDATIDGNLLVQHPAGDDTALTLVQAGRDLRVGPLGTLRVAGAGDVVAIAGRDVDLGRGPGIVTLGNQENDLQLPAGGAGLTVLAGVTWADYAQAVAHDVHLLGGGFESVPSQLAVQLESLKQSGTLLDAASMAAAAKAFDALPDDAKAARVTALVGEAAFASGSAAYLDRTVARLEAISRDATAAAAAGRITGSNRLGATPPVPGGEVLPDTPVFPAGSSDAQRAALQAQVEQQLRAALRGRALGAVLADYAQTLDPATRRALTYAVSPYTAALRTFVAQRTGSTPTSDADADARFAALPPEQQALFVNDVLVAELRAAGREALTVDRVQYLRGYDAIDALFPGARPVGVISLANSQVKTAQGGDIRLLAPGGGVNVGDLAGGGIAKSASDVGIVTVAGGDVDAVVRDSVDVNQSRVFTLAEGNLMLWASEGNLDAGRGAKTVVGAPPPLVTINASGQVVVDTAGSFSGSGIAVLDAASTLDLYAPLGEINAGEAGIKSAGTAFLGATVIVNANDIKAAGGAVGVPAKPPEAPTASLAGLAQAAGAATAQQADAAKDDDDPRRRKRPRRNLFLDFLGFARGE